MRLPTLLAVNISGVPLTEGQVCVCVCVLSCLVFVCLVLSHNPTPVTYNFASRNLPRVLLVFVLLLLKITLSD